MAGAGFQFQNVKIGQYFDANSTGAVWLTVPAGMTTQAQTLQFIDVPLEASDNVTTTLAYDPASTTTIAYYVGPETTGTHYLFARLQPAGLMRWTYFVKNPSATEVSPGFTSTEELRAKYRTVALRKLNAFYDFDTTGVWLANDPDTDFHWMREDVYYAATLFSTGSAQDASRANTVLRKFCAAQNLSPTPASDYGYFYTNGTDRRVPDSSCTFFCTPILARMLLHPPDGFDTQTSAAIAQAIGPATSPIKVLFDAHYTLDHTNFQALGIAALALTGRALHDDSLVLRARTQMQALYDHWISHGGQSEYNSPVYTGVTTWALRTIIEDSGDDVLTSQAKILHERMWLDAALHHHPGFRLFAGPYSRIYKDGVFGGTTLAGYFAELETLRTGYSSPGRFAENAANLHSLDMNPMWFESQFQSRISPELVEVLTSRTLPGFSRESNPYNDTACYVSSSFSLGTASVVSNATHEGFFVQAKDANSPANVCCIFSRAALTDDEVLDFDTETNRTDYAVQDHQRAIIFCDEPAGPAIARRAAYALVADERFANWTSIRINGTTATLPAALTVGGKVTAIRGTTFLAVQPIFAVANGIRERAGLINAGMGHLNIAVHCADTSVSQIIPAARIEAGFAVEADEAGNWNSYDSFVTDVLQNWTINVSESPTSRTVEWSRHGNLGFDFDRQAHQFTQRRISGAPFATELADSEFAVQSSNGNVTIRDFSVQGLFQFSWLEYIPGGNHVLLVNPSANAANITTNWTGATELAPYSFTRITRPQASRIANWDSYDN